jgi:hypothetical protein
MPRIYNAPPIHQRLKIDEPQELKALLIVGPDTNINPEIKALYEKNNNCLIIGDGKNSVTIEDIKNTLKSRNLKIGSNTRIDIDAHCHKEGKKHFLQLNVGYTKMLALVSTEDLLQQLDRCLIPLFICIYGHVMVARQIKMFLP